MMSDRSKKDKMPSKPILPSYKEPLRPLKPHTTSRKKLIG